MKSELRLYEIKPQYIRFLHGVDKRVSVKYNNRPYVGIVTMINGIKYVLPLTSQTTQERKKNGKNKRSSIITTFVKDSSGREIANILHNNMFPVKNGVYTALNIDAKVDTYESNEIRFIRKHNDVIIKKAEKVYNDRKNKNNPFLHKTCCDFEELEKHYMNYAE